MGNGNSVRPVLHPHSPICSDSSMGNGNACTSKKRTSADQVQIPLWAMATSRYHSSLFLHPSCSDSSMGNGNVLSWRTTGGIKYVQIPLWAMATIGLDLIQLFSGLFRFLYGQWQPAVHQPNVVMIIGFRFLYGQWQPTHSRPSFWRRDVQIPLWAMATLLPGIAWPGPGTFRFLYGQWQPLMLSPS